MKKISLFPLNPWFFSLWFSTLFLPLTSLNFVHSFFLNLKHYFSNFFESLIVFLYQFFRYFLPFFSPFSFQDSFILLRVVFFITKSKKSHCKTNMVLHKIRWLREDSCPSFPNLPRKKGSGSFCNHVGSIWSREGNHKFSQLREFFFFSHDWLSVLLWQGHREN